MPSNTPKTPEVATKFQDTVVIGDLTLADFLDDNPPQHLDFTLFERYAERRFASENVRFYRDVRAYADPNATPDSRLGEVAARIAAQYLLPGSPSEINVSDALRTEALARVKCLEESIDRPATAEARTIFKKCQMDVFNLLITDVYRPFIAEETNKQRLRLARRAVLWWLPGDSKHFKMKEFFTFPDPVNEAESRLNNGVTVTLAAVSFSLDFTGYFRPALVIWCYMLYGFIARTLCGPRLDVTPLLVHVVLRPISERLGLLKTEFKSGPPKQFAQFIGAVFSALIIFLRVWIDKFAAWVMLWLLATCASMSSFFGLCIACDMFLFVARNGWLPAATREKSLQVYVIQPSPLPAPSPSPSASVVHVEANGAQQEKDHPQPHEAQAAGRIWPVALNCKVHAQET